MSVWLQNLPLGWMALWVFTLTYLATWEFRHRHEARRGGADPHVQRRLPRLAAPLGIIFGLFVAFIASQVWNDVDRAKAAVNREASALSTVVSLAASFPGEPQARLRDLTRRHIEEAVANEWPMMARQSASLTVAPVSLAEEMELVNAPSRDGRHARGDG